MVGQFELSGYQIRYALSFASSFAQAIEPAYGLLQAFLVRGEFISGNKVETL